MITSYKVLFGSPLEHVSERRFLLQLCSDLEKLTSDYLILANFFLPPDTTKRQIDFLVVLPTTVCHVELKGLNTPVIGTANGPWRCKMSDGSERPLDGNPFSQAQSCKLEIHDQMHRFSNKQKDLWSPPKGGKFYKHLKSVVCVFPELLPGSDVPSNFKVNTFGYAELLSHLLTCDTRPNWSIDDWRSFASSIGLSPENRQSSASESERVIERYHDRLSAELENCQLDTVATTIQITGDQRSSLNCNELVRHREHIQLVGISGIGKSLHTQSMVLQALSDGQTPIFIRAIDYAGRLTKTMDRNIAHLYENTSGDLVSRLRHLGRPVLLGSVRKQ